MLPKERGMRGPHIFFRFGRARGADRIGQGAELGWFLIDEPEFDVNRTQQTAALDASDARKPPPSGAYDL